MFAALLARIHTSSLNVCRDDKVGTHEHVDVFLVAISLNIIMQDPFFLSHVKSQMLFTLVCPLLNSGAPDASSPEPWWEFISRSQVIKSLSKVFEMGMTEIVFDIQVSQLD